MVMAFYSWNNLHNWMHAGRNLHGSRRSDLGLVIRFLVLGTGGGGPVRSGRRDARSAAGFIVGSLPGSCTQASLE